MRRVLQIAAAVLVLTGGVAYFGGLFRPTLAFAEVAKKVAEAESMTYRITIRHPDLKEPIVTRFSTKGAGLTHMEQVGGRITVVDAAHGKTLTLDPDSKTAIVTETKEMKEASTVSLIEQFRNFAGKDAKPVGKKTMGDVEANGFLIVVGGYEMTVWADPKTRLPIRVDAKMSVGGKEIETTMDDFQVNPKLDDSLFSLDPPAGYKLVVVAIEQLLPEEDVVRILGIYAKNAGDVFPKKFDDWHALIQAHSGEKIPNALEDPAFMKYMQSIGRATVFPFTLKSYGYKGDGVKRGDADKIVFWYKPEKADKYRVVYGDLKTGDVAADKLPK